MVFMLLELLFSNFFGTERATFVGALMWLDPKKSKMIDTRIFDEVFYWRSNIVIFVTYTGI